MKMNFLLIVERAMQAGPKIDANANSICHARMTLSGIHDFNGLQSGFPIKITSGMTICESIKDFRCKNSWQLFWYTHHGGEEFR